jgi:hypothetical protein
VHRSGTVLVRPASLRACFALLARHYGFHDVSARVSILWSDALRFGTRDAREPPMYRPATFVSGALWFSQS